MKKELEPNHPFGNLKFTYEKWLSLEQEINSILKKGELNTYQKAVKIHCLVEKELFSYENNR